MTNLTDLNHEFESLSQLIADVQKHVIVFGNKQGESNTCVSDILAALNKADDYLDEAKNELTILQQEAVHQDV